MKVVITYDNRREAEAYLPGNYEVVHEAIEQREFFSVVHPGGKRFEEELVFVVAGEDVAGWTLEGYVIPRYASGLIGAEEIDLPAEDVDVDCNAFPEGVPDAR